MYYVAEPLSDEIFLTQKFKPRIINVKISQSKVIYKYKTQFYFLW